MIIFHNIKLIGFYKYSWPLNNMGLNWMGHLYTDFFLIVNTMVLHHLHLVEFVNVEPWIRRKRKYRGPTLNYTLIFDSDAPSPSLFKGQHNTFWNRLQLLILLMQVVCGLNTNGGISTSVKRTFLTHNNHLDMLWQVDLRFSDSSL